MHENQADNPSATNQAAAEKAQLGSEAETDGILVTVRPRFVPEHSDPESGRYAFSYQVKIENVGDRTARLTRRHWEIVDAEGDRKIVDDEGVVGEQPVLGPADTFEYASWCPLETPWGTMEGFYTFERENGDTFEASIGRFYLVAGDVTAGDAVSV